MKRKQRSNVLGEAVREAREDAGLQQVALSALLDYTYNVVSAWENGSKPLFASEWPRICEQLPELDPALADKYKTEFGGDESRKLGSRPSRLAPQVTEALNAVVAQYAAGRPMTEVADAAGLDYVGFWKMLKGSSNPTIPQLQQLADYFKIDLDVLMGRRPVAAPSYAQLQALVIRQREELAEKNVLLGDMDRIRKLNDLLLRERGL